MDTENLIQYENEARWDRDMVIARTIGNLDAHRIWSDHMDRLRHIEMMRIHDRINNKPLVTSTYTPYRYYLPRTYDPYDYSLTTYKRPSYLDFEKEFEDAVRTPVPYVRRSYYHYYPDTVTRSYVSSYPVTTRTYVSTYPIVRRSYLTPYRTRSYYLSTSPDYYTVPYTYRYLY